MSTHNICFHGELTKIILQLSSNTFLICSSATKILTNWLRLWKVMLFFSLKFSFVASESSIKYKECNS